MSDFNLSSIGELLTGGGLSAIAKRLKVGSGDIAKVLSSGIPSMIAGMQNNASTQEGEDSLAHALADHSEQATDDIGAFFSAADLKDGKKILGHIFGDNQKATVEEISKASGVSTRKATSILALVAPLLLSLLGKQNSQQSGGGLGSLLGGLLGGGSGSQQSNVEQSAGLLSGLFSAAGADQNDGNQGGFLNGLLNLFH